MAKPGTFPKGVSGNPGGRPKALVEVQDLARMHTKEAIASLASIAMDENQPAAARVSANIALLERGWGKPVQPIEASGPNGGPIQTQAIADDTRPSFDVFLAEFTTKPTETKH